MKAVANSLVTYTVSAFIKLIYTKPENTAERIDYFQITENSSHGRVKYDTLPTQNSVLLHF